MGETIQITNIVPGCDEEVKRTNTFVWLDMWVSKNEEDKFDCNKGKRKVCLSPKLTQAKVRVVGCKGCEHFTG